MSKCSHGVWVADTSVPGEIKCMLCGDPMPREESAMSSFIHDPSAGCSHIWRTAKRLEDGSACAICERCGAIGDSPVSREALVASPGDSVCVECKHCTWPPEATGNQAMLHMLTTCRHPKLDDCRSVITGAKGEAACVIARLFGGCGELGLWWEKRNEAVGA